MDGRQVATVSPQPLIMGRCGTCVASAGLPSCLAETLGTHPWVLLGSRVCWRGGVAGSILHWQQGEDSNLSTDGVFAHIQEKSTVEKSTLCTVICVGSPCPSLSHSCDWARTLGPLGPLCLVNVGTGSKRGPRKPLSGI